MFEGLKRSVKKLINSVGKVKLKEQELETLLWNFKVALIQCDVAVSVADQICSEVEKKLRGTEIARFENKQTLVETTLRESLTQILHTEEEVNLINMIKEKKKTREPFIIIFIGINGTGKTTTIGKVASLLLDNGFSVILAGSDTYRAGSIEQLESHAKQLGIRAIKHTYGADAAAVAFDAIKHARARGINTVLVDTAGRMQTNKNLMEEMRKIVRVTTPDLIIFVADALTGNDAVEQAQHFSQYVEFHASILTKIDADAKGGAAISIAYATKKPIIFWGTGQRYEDLTPFNPDFLLEKIFS
jgi:fused signal recognition particle receptor